MDVIKPDIRTHLLHSIQTNDVSPYGRYTGSQMADPINPYPRLLASAVREALEDAPVVCLLGPRQCGKTTLVQQLAPNRPYISLDDLNLRRVAHRDPVGFVASLPHAITLDEAQFVPVLLPSIKLAVDRDRRPGRFLLTGSSNLLLAPQVTESLAGRMEIIQLYPLTEAEKERKSGQFLKVLLANGFRSGIGDTSSTGGSTLPERIVSGGYPEALTRSPSRARQWRRQYLRGIVERDIRDVARVKHIDELARLIEIQAIRSATLWNSSNAARSLGLRRETVDQYLAVLERLYLVRRLPAWHRNEAKRLVRAPKVHLLDSGLAASLAGLTAEDWLGQRDRMGRLLESFAVQQIIAQGAWTDPDLRFWHYRDKDQVEVDLVVTRGRKTWGVEIKAADSLASRDGRGLRRLATACGEDFQSGVLLYNGSDVLPLQGDTLLAVPLSSLWDR